MIYTLKIDNAGIEFLEDLKEIVLHETTIWGLNYDVDMYSCEITVETQNIRVLKRLVDIIESKEFMRDQG